MESFERLKEETTLLDTSFLGERILRPSIADQASVMMGKILSSKNDFNIGDLAWFKDNRLDEVVRQETSQQCAGLSAKQTLEWLNEKLGALQSVIHEYESPLREQEQASKKSVEYSREVIDQIECATKLNEKQKTELLNLLNNLDLATPKGLSASSANKAIETVLSLFGFRNHGDPYYDQHRRLDYSSFSETFIPHVVKNLVEIRRPDAYYDQHETARVRLCKLQQMLRHSEWFAELHLPIAEMGTPEAIVKTVTTETQKRGIKNYPESFKNLQASVALIERCKENWSTRRPVWKDAKAGVAYLNAEIKNSAFYLLLSKISDAVHVKADPIELSLTYLHAEPTQQTEVIESLILTRKELNFLQPLRKRRFNFYMGIFLIAEFENYAKHLPQEHGTFSHSTQFDLLFTRIMETAPFLWKPHREEISRRLDSLPVSDATKNNLKLILASPKEKEKIKERLLERQALRDQFETSQSTLAAIRELDD